MTSSIKTRLHSAKQVWRAVDGAYHVSRFTAKLHGWNETRRFIVVRERVREDRQAVGRRLLEVPGYTLRVWVTNRPEDALTLWRDDNGRATVEPRIEERKNDLHADGFCPQRFFATEAAFLPVIFAYNLLSVYQAQVTRQSGWRQPATLRAAVFVCGAVLGRAGRRLSLRLSQTGGGLARHKPLILKASEPPKPIAPLLPRPPILTDDLIPTDLAAGMI